MAKVSDLPVEGTFDAGDLFFITSELGVSKSLAGQKLIDEFLVEAPTDGEVYARKNGAWYSTKTVDQYLDFTPQDEATTHVEGRVYYDNIEKTLSVQSEIEGTTLNIGQEQYMKVINNTGVLIDEGTAVRADNVDAIAELAQIVPALADTIEHARILGVVTNPIADGESGYVTTFGKVNGLDTDTLTVGLPLYLSDTVAGTYSTVPPASGLLTQVGGCLVSDLLVGTVLVRVQNTIALPTLFSVMQTTSMTPTMSSTHQEIKPFATGTALGPDQSLTLGTMTLPNVGWYRWSMAMTITMASASAGGDLIQVELFDLTNSTVLGATSLTIDNTNLTGSRSVAIPFVTTAVDDVLVMRVWSADSTAVLTFNSMSFDIESISYEIA